jgi:hypothetical protein
MFCIWSNLKVSIINSLFTSRLNSIVFSTLFGDNTFIPIKHPFDQLGFLLNIHMIYIMVYLEGFLINSLVTLGYIT